jgi:hypothetical protein
MTAATSESIPAMTIFFAPIGSGLGDAIVGLPILQTLIAANSEPVCLVARSQRQMGLTAHIPGLAATVRECDLPQIKTAGDTFLNMRDHPLVRTWNWGSDAFARTYPGYFINEIQRVICTDLGIYPDFSRTVPLAHKVDPATRGKILLAAGTTSDHKSWPVDYWLILGQQLQEQGFDCLLLGEPERSKIVAQLIDSGISHYATETVSAAIDAISSARLVVAVDTGLMHIAVQQGIATAAIFNNLNTYMRPYANCHAIMAPRCQPECIAAVPDRVDLPVTYEWGWWDGKFEWCRVEPEKYCMYQVTPQMVLKTILGLKWPSALVGDGIGMQA